MTLDKDSGKEVESIGSDRCWGRASYPRLSTANSDRKTDRLAHERFASFDLGYQDLEIVAKHKSCNHNMHLHVGEADNLGSVQGKKDVTR